MVLRIITNKKEQTVGSVRRVRYNQVAGAAMSKKTTRKELAALQGEYEARLHALMDTLPDAIFFKDLKSRFTRINRALAERFGLADPSEAVGKSDFDFFNPAHAQRAYDAEQEIVRTGNPLVDMVEKEVWPDGRETWVSTTKMPLRDAQGAVIGTFGLSRDVTTHQRSEEALRDSEALYHSLVENLPQNIFRKDLEGRFTFANQRFCATTGRKLEDILGQTDFDFFPTELARKYQEDDRRVIKTGQVFETVEEHQPPGKDKIYVRVIKTPIHDSRGYVIGVQGMFWDVTELTRAQEELEATQRRYALALAGANDGIWDWNLATNEVFYSTRWKSMLGCREDEIEPDPEEWMKRVHPGDLERLKADLATHLAGRTAHFENEHRVLHKERAYRWVLARGIAIRDASGKPARMAGSLTDVTDRKRAEEELAHQAFYDALTDLPNRLLFLDRLSQAIRRARRRGGRLFAILFLDLDRFKDVNDSLGHAVGDLLLTTIARRLEACVRPGDTVARLGGDEFTILIDDMRQAEDAVNVAQRIQRDLTQPFNLNGHEVFTSVSIGIAPGAPEDGPEDLLRDADTAMYRAKERGKNRYEVFDKAMHSRAVARLQLETDLRRALEREEFRVFYQPIVSLRTDSIVGFEALVRWKHPQRDLVPPSEFLPLAEETGLIIPIDLWVVREACRQTRAWQERYPQDPALSINVNLSSKHFGQTALVDRIDEILRDTRLNPETLRVEITESVIMEESKAINEVLSRLKAMRLQLYLDDFGTGYSSLGYLHRFPIDSLKIHHSFVGQLGGGDHQGELVRTITTLAGNLNMGVVAEGVETEAQLAELRQLHCERVQGFLFSRPVSAEAAEALLASRPRWSRVPADV
jgi:diguanylate cyclase (GGDEF)-like protein/PAS domain S-box-containing protein